VEKAIRAVEWVISLPWNAGTNVVVTIHDEIGMRTRVPLGTHDMTIGSGEGARVRLVGLPPSTQAKVYRATDGRLLLRNVGGTTDIRLNGKILLDEAELVPEDQAAVGTFLLVFTEE
jgi:hypothetical protein